MEALFEVFSAPSSPSSPLPPPSSKPSPVPQSSRSSEEDFPVLFCSSFAGRTIKLLHNGFVKQGLLQCILDCTDCFPHCFTGGSIPLFGHMTVTCSSLHNNNNNSLFLIFRHHLYNIISSTGNSVSLKYCCEFLHFIVTYVSRLSLMTHTATLDGIITNLTNTIQSLESCDQLNEDGMHVLLHVYWTMVSLLYTAVTVLGDKYVSMFNEECNRIIKYLHVLKQREDTFDTVSPLSND
ncbi:PREDICTED: uncharacterized protein LOC109589384 [Amphimedon queenslandica]|uniref:Uncharacterized protein n=1 Tax=Amphimedon queenslandica TaxID=400682 RepID=A0AAN0JVW4_AMPQE|nr:PREDICTED: uncharacterized protein LOC109589384 [Amphimedon queenslandica]|eukprot:XP_019861034.1 PREDICTED: uncharacterized protein LOC109589384 [Amphimedon queenslandica]